MAVVVGCALLAGGFGEEEGAPVGEASDDATGGEDLVACCARDSGGDVLEVRGGGGCGGVWDGGVLFDLVDAAARTDLENCISTACMESSAPQLTTPINSYNMADMCWWLFARRLLLLSPVMFERLAATSSPYLTLVQRNLLGLSSVCKRQGTSRPTRISPT